jgi:hypothetical protein
MRVTSSWQVDVAEGRSIEEQLVSTSDLLGSGPLGWPT